MNHHFTRSKHSSLKHLKRPQALQGGESITTTINHGGSSKQIVSDEIRPSILIVDDTPFNIAILILMLTRTGINECDILHTTNGFEAIELLKAHPSIRIIFMDIEMPIINGFQATQIIKDSFCIVEHQKKLSSCKLYLQQQQQLNLSSSQHHHKHRPFSVVAYTSLDDEETIAKCKQYGMDSFLSKPCNINQVSAILNSYLI